MYLGGGSENRYQMNVVAVANVAGGWLSISQLIIPGQANGEGEVHLHVVVSRQAFNDVVDTVHIAIHMLYKAR